MALFVDPGSLGYVASDHARRLQRVGHVHRSIAQHAGLADQIAGNALPESEFYPFAALDQIYSEPVGLQVGRFIAFAYTYHYFNWFSKASIIRWHEVPRLRLAVIATLWLASIALYAHDYQLGVRWLLFLSVLHVLLEFPLDHKTLLAIGSELYARVRPKAG